MSARAHIIVVLITVAMVAVIVRQVRMRRLRAKYALLWLAVGAVIVPIALIPGLLDRVASSLGIAYGPALLLVLGLGFFALLSLHFSCELSRPRNARGYSRKRQPLLRSELWDHDTRIGSGTTPDGANDD